MNKGRKEGMNEGWNEGWVQGEKIIITKEGLIDRWIRWNGR